jgi:ribosomal protein S18 acetylase RimI-like enzyme
MPLPILHDPTDPTPDNLIRLFHRTELHWVRHVGEETQLDTGVALTNPELPAVWDANLVMDAALPPGGSPEAAVDEVEQHFARAGVPCRQWIMNPAAPAERVWPLAEHLTGQGWQRHPYDIMHRTGRAARVANEVEGLTIIPARASFRHARALAEEAAAECGVPQLADASVLHLDDPHWDALMALRDGAAVARAGVLAVGELGRIEQVFVSAPYRRRGIGRTMMGRVLEICARSLFKHVMLSVHPHDRPAIEMYRGLGFRRIGEIVFYRQP